MSRVLVFGAHTINHKPKHVNDNPITISNIKNNFAKIGYFISNEFERFEPENTNNRNKTIN